MSFLNTMHRNSYFPKSFSFFGALAFFILFIFNKSQFKIPFLEWGMGALVFIAFVFFVLLRCTLRKQDLFTIALPLLWVPYAFACWPFSVNPSHHITALVQVILLTLLSSSVVIALFSQENLISKTVFYTALAWTLINILLFFAWEYGAFIYEKKAFSGIFRNRNEFSMQGIILISLLFFFVKKKGFAFWCIVVANILMIIASLSLSAFILLFFVLSYPLFLKGKPVTKIRVVTFTVLFMVLSLVLLQGVRDRLIRFGMVFSSPEILRQSESAFLRSWLLSEGLKVLAENPLFGVGVDNARFVLIHPLALASGKETGLYAHNNYFEVALSSGIPGLLLFYLPLLFIYCKLKKNHPYWIELKTFLALYCIMGITVVQYNVFITIFLHCLIVFIFFAHRNSSIFNTIESI